MACGEPVLALGDEHGLPGAGLAGRKRILAWREEQEQDEQAVEGVFAG